MHCESVGGELAKGFKFAAVALASEKESRRFRCFRNFVFPVKIPFTPAKASFPTPFSLVPDVRRVKHVPLLGGFVKVGSFDFPLVRRLFGCGMVAVVV